MKVYELESKIADRIKSNISASCVMSLDIKSNKTTAADNIPILDMLRPSSLNEDSIWTPAILVTTNWNKNDDVFTPSETFEAKDTPINKPVNWQHNGEEDNNEIIGVINSSIAVDDRYIPITEPINKFHIAIGMIVWSKYFPDYAAKISMLVDENKLFVSMECFFNDFGYALKDSSGTIRLVERDENTSKLSQYLRAYGGPGQLTIRGVTYQIGRWVKDITFSGVAYVYNPANPESVIISDPESGIFEEDEIESFASYKPATKSLISLILKENLIDCVLDNIEKGETMADTKANDTVANEAVAKLEAEKATLQAKMDELQCQLNNLNAQMKDNMDNLKCAEDKVKCAEDKVKCAETELMAKLAEAEKSATASIADKELKIKELAENLQAAQSKLTDIEKSGIAQKRLVALKEFSDVTDDAKTLAELKDMNDVVFTQILSYVKSVKKEVVKAETKEETEVKIEKEIVNASANESDKIEANASKATDNSTDIDAKIKNLKEIVAENWKSRNKNR